MTLSPLTIVIKYDAFLFVSNTDKGYAFFHIK